MTRKLRIVLPTWSRPLILFIGVLLVWRLLVALSVAPPYLLPPPEEMFGALWTHRVRLATDAATTFSIALIGFAIGSAFGALNAITLARSDRARRWLLPILVGGQAVPVFALGPLLTLWFGYGAPAKIVMTTLVVYFPVTAAFYHGLTRVDPRLIDMARVMGAAPQTELWRLRVQAALPALGTGLRMAAVFAPISAIIGEMTGAARGLGPLMDEALGRGREELMFAALFLLALFGVLFHALVRYGTRRMTPWAPEASVTD